MTSSLLPFRGRRLISPVLFVFLLLGHACDVPGYVDLVIHADAAEDSHHSMDQRGDEHAVRCDAAGVMPSPTYSRVDLGLDLVTPVPVDGPTLFRSATRSVERLAELPSRPPLFLLYASLLI